MPVDKASKGERKDGTDDSSSSAIGERADDNVKGERRRSSSVSGDERRRSSKKRKKRHRRDDSDEESSANRERRRSKKHRKHRKYRKKSHRRDDDSSVSSDDSESTSSRRRHRKKHSKKKKSKKKDQIDDAPSFGKYGLLKKTDFSRMQRTFEVWMAEVKGVQNQQMPKWEVQEYFDTFREDFNTCTMPHKKFYDYDAWEMQEYAKKKQNESTSSRAVSDERSHQLEQQQRRDATQQAALQLAASTMSSIKVADMKRQQQLRTQMQIAFKTGDKETYRRLKDKLEADE